MATLKDTCNPAPTDQQALPHFVLADHEKFPVPPSEPGAFAVIVQTERYRLADDSWLALEEGDGLVFRSNLPPGTGDGEGVLGWYESRPHELAFLGARKGGGFYDPATGEPVSSDGLTILGILLERRRIYEDFVYTPEQREDAGDATLATLAVVEASIAAEAAYRVEQLSWVFNPILERRGSMIAVR